MQSLYIVNPNYNIKELMVMQKKFNGLWRHFKKGCKGMELKLTTTLYNCVGGIGYLQTIIFLSI
jgi:hypothetical protein